MADTIDLNYLIDQFKDDSPEADVREELFGLITDVMKLFGIARHLFLQGLSEKMEFSKYVD